MHFCLLKYTLLSRLLLSKPVMLNLKQRLFVSTILSTTVLISGCGGSESNTIPPENPEKPPVENPEKPPVENPGIDPIENYCTLLAHEGEVEFNAFWTDDNQYVEIEEKYCQAGLQINLLSNGDLNASYKYIDGYLNIRFSSDQIGQVDDFGNFTYDSYDNNKVLKEAWIGSSNLTTGNISAMEAISKLLCHEKVSDFDLFESCTGNWSNLLFDGIEVQLLIDSYGLKYNNE